jgi:hypothetical protein
VAVTMAIVAASLAGVTLLSHRGHNDTLRLQTEANIHHTKANICHTEASDQWAFYQAKNIRSHEFQAYLMMASFLGSEPGSEEAKKRAVKYWTSQVEKYEGKTEKGKRRGEGGDLAKIMEKAKAYEEEAKEQQAEAKAKEHESHVVHKSVNWIDIGHLGLEFALVLCSVAVLTKLRSFWFSGIGVAVVGAALALYGVYAMLLAEH